MEISSDASRLLRAKALIVQFHDSNVGTPNAHNLYAHSLLIMGSGSSHKIILQSLYQNNLFYPFLVKLGIELTRGFTCFFCDWKGVQHGTFDIIWYPFGPPPECSCLNTESFHNCQITDPSKPRALFAEYPMACRQLRSLQLVFTADAVWLRTNT